MLWAWVPSPCSPWLLSPCARPKSRSPLPPSPIRISASPRCRPRLVRTSIMRRIDRRLQQLIRAALRGRPRRRHRRERPHHLPQGLWRDGSRIGRSGHPGNRVPLGVGLEGRRRDDGRKAGRAGEGQFAWAGLELRADAEASGRRRKSRDGRRHAEPPARTLSQRLRQQAGGRAGHQAPPPDACAAEPHLPARYLLELPERRL